MINIFTRRELYCTFSMEEYGKICALLDEGNVAYQVAVAGSDRNRHRGWNVATEYTIYVNKADYERARHILREAGR